MSELILEQMSPALHFEIGERHARLADQSIGGRDLAGKIRAPLTGLKTNIVEHESAVMDQRSALDNVHLQRELLANALRSFSGAVKEIDRDAGLWPVLDMLFQGRTMTEIVGLSYRKLPVAVAEIVTLVEDLPEGHPVYERLPALVERKAALETATDDYDNKIEVARKKRAQKYEAMRVVRRQYADNYFEARSMMPKKIAERLFPKIRSTKDAGEEVDEDMLDGSGDVSCDQGTGDGELASAA